MSFSRHVFAAVWATPPLNNGVSAAASRDRLLVRSKFTKIVTRDNSVLEAFKPGRPIGDVTRGFGPFRDDGGEDVVVFSTLTLSFKPI
jgi:hypothetical protein